jgi:hypothetical protein
VTHPPQTTTRRGDCPCGTGGHTPTGWCGLNHHGIGCHYTDTPLTDVPRLPGSPATVAVCARCAARALWWQTDPYHRPETHPGGPLGRVLLMPDGSRNPIGRTPRYVTY